MRLKIDGEYLNNLRFADDIVLLSNSGEDRKLSVIYTGRV